MPDRSRKIFLSPGPPQQWADLSADILHRGRLTCGETVEQFEHAFAEYIGSAYAVMVNSGSSANFLVMAALGLPKGAKVIVPALTWPTTVAPVIQLGLEPVFVDADVETFQQDIDEIFGELNSGVAAVWIAHIMGNVTPVTDVLFHHLPEGVRLLEDCCEAFGTKYRGQHVGTFGLAGTFSFFMTHQLMTGEGGMVVTDDYEFYKKLKSMRSHGWGRDYSDLQVAGLDPRFTFAHLGYNFRPTELNAAFGLQQLEAWSDNALTRNEVYESMRRIKGCIPIAITPLTSPSPFAYAARSPKKLAIMASLEEAGIENRPLLGGNLLRHPAFQAYGSAKDYPGAETLTEEGFYWPCHHGLTEEDVERIELAILRAAV